jgi:hypothetical protein
MLWIADVREGEEDVALAALCVNGRVRNAGPDACHAASQHGTQAVDVERLQEVNALLQHATACITS